MFDMFRKLIFSKELSFEEGKITMLRGRLIMIPIHIFVSIYKELQKLKGVDEDKFMYEIGKQEGIYWINELKKKYTMKPDDMFKWGMHSMSLAGWAKFKIIKVDLIKRDHAIYIAYDSAFSSFLGRTGKLSDPLIAGFFGGGGSVIYNKSLVCKEVKCISKGDPYCEFIVKKSKEDWLPKYLKVMNIKK